MTAQIRAVIKIFFVLFLVLSSLPTHAATVGGIITEETTWTLSESPYVIETSVQVDYGVTLNIEPGVTVEGGAIEVFGTLEAIGTSSSPIIFNNVVIGSKSNYPSSPAFINLSFTNINNGSLWYSGRYGYLNLRDSIILNIPRIYLWYPTADSYIERNIFLSSGKISVGASPGSVFIRNNYFSGTAVESWAGTVLVEYNTFVLSDSTVVKLSPGYSSPGMVANNNYWGTTDTTIIEGMIYDKNDDLSCNGYISFDPILTAPHPNTPTITEITVSDSISPDNDLRLPFGDVTVGNIVEQTVTVTNDGDADLALGELAQEDELAEPFTISSDNCSNQTLSSGSSCTVTLSFSPQTVGSYYSSMSDSFDIPSNDLDEPSITISVNGNGTPKPAPDITVTCPLWYGSSLYFGDVTEGSSADQIVTVTNHGNADLILGQIAEENDLSDPFTITADTCSGQTLIPSSNCSLTVTFEPQSGATFSDTFDIPSNDPDESSVSVNVDGNGVLIPVPDISITDSITPNLDLYLPFDDLAEGNTTERTIVITNNGCVALTMGQVGEENALESPFEITSDFCSGETIDPGNNCYMTIAFAPEIVGSFSDAFTIPSNDPDEQSQVVRVEGKGLSSVVNNPPSMPKLLYPANGQEGLGTNISFKWEPSQDPDGDTFSYQLYYSEDSEFNNVEPVLLVSIVNQKTLVAGFGLAAIILGCAGCPYSLRRKFSLLMIITAIALSMSLTACGSGGGSDYSPSDDSVSKEVTDLNSGTTYYWKIVAEDEGGETVESEVRTFTTE